MVRSNLVQCSPLERHELGLSAHAQWIHGSQASPLNVSLDTWLSDSECELAARFGHNSRRTQWLAARFVAKQLIVEHLRKTCSSPIKIDLRSVYIQSTDAAGRSIRPRVYVAGRLQDWSLSISHSESIVYVALSTQKSLSVGVDVIDMQSPNRARLSAWMSGRERQTFSAKGDRWCAARAWAVKEAVYKATNHGESFVPGELEVFRDRRGRLGCRLPDGQVPSTLQINSRESGGHFYVLAAASTGRRMKTAEHDRFTQRLNLLTFEDALL